MQAQILELVRENPRTTKELSDALGLTKDQVLTALSLITSIKPKAVISYGGRGRPVVVVRHTFVG